MQPKERNLYLYRNIEAGSMIHPYEQLVTDIEKVKQIPIVPTMLEVICRSTGMGFAAVARVTQDRWIACSVRDEIQFGLEPGGELKIETTICNEIRDNRKAVIIDHVANDDAFRNHHTPKMYGFQSYISVPVILKNGEFFGTLCAIDPNPAQLNNTKTIGMFNLFAELISFHLQSQDLIQQSTMVVKDLNRQLTDSIDENRQYQFISNHNLQEPLRKIRVFSSMLVNAAAAGDADKTKELALKVNSGAQRFSMMIKDLSDFSALSNKDVAFEVVDLNRIVVDVCAQLTAKIEAKKAIITIGDLPSLRAIPLQIEQLFYHLISNALRFSKEAVTPVIKISSKTLTTDEVSHELPVTNTLKYVEICVEDNGVGIEPSQLEKIFDIFTRLSYDQSLDGFGVGLAYCRKIIRNHGGIITAQSTPGVGTGFSVVLPYSE